VGRARARGPWLSGAIVALAAALSLAGGAAPALQYEREAVLAGETWRLLAGQLVHWTPRMAAADLGALFALGAWLEARGRRGALLATLGLGALLTAAAIHVGSPRLALYRGSSGIAAALFVRVALGEAAAASGRARAALAVAAVALPAKAAFEAAAGLALFAGPLPPGILVHPLAHLAGAAAGCLAALARRPGRAAG
jgi:hypothetical protein